MHSSTSGSSTTMVSHSRPPRVSIEPGLRCASSAPEGETEGEPESETESETERSETNRVSERLVALTRCEKPFYTTSVS